jgi:hypothetical protein
MTPWPYPVRRPDEDVANARRHLRAARHLIDDAEPRITDALHTLALLAADGYPTAGGGPTAGIADPTLGAVLSRQGGPDAAGRHREGAADLHGQITGLSVEVHGILVQLIKVIQRVPTPIDTAATARQARCTGAPTEPWGDPTCTNLAVRGDLCWACIKREQRARMVDELGEWT